MIKHEASKRGDSFSTSCGFRCFVNEINFYIETYKIQILCVLINVMQSQEYLSYHNDDSN